MKKSDSKRFDLRDECNLIYQAYGYDEYIIRSSNISLMSEVRGSLVWSVEDFLRGSEALINKLQRI